MFGPWPGCWLIDVRLDGVGHRRLGVRLALQDPPVEGRGGSLCGEWSFCQRVGDEGPSWDPAFAEHDLWTWLAAQKRP